MDRDFTDYEWYETPPRERWIRSHLYLRTRLAIVNSEEQISALADNLPERTSVLLQRGEELQWKNGLVLSVHTPAPTRELAEMLRDSLSEFDAWALIDEDGLIIEGPMPGPLSLHFSGKRRTEYAQLFLKFRRHNDPDEIISRIKSGLHKAGVTRPVFFYEDGRVLFIETNQPVGVISNRIQKEVLSLYSFMAVDCTGRSWSPDRSCRWGAFFEN